MNFLEVPLLLGALGVPCVVEADVSKESNAKNRDSKNIILFAILEPHFNPTGG